MNGSGGQQWVWWGCQELLLSRFQLAPRVVIDTFIFKTANLLLIRMSSNNATHLVDNPYERRCHDYIPTHPRSLRVTHTRPTEPLITIDDSEITLH